MLAASSVGMISRLACPLSREFGNSCSARSPRRQREIGLHLALDLQSGAWARISASAACILRARGRRRRAEVGMREQRHLRRQAEALHASAASSVISTICSAVGSGITWVSQMKNVPCGRMMALRRRELAHAAPQPDDVARSPPDAGRSGRWCRRSWRRPRRAGPSARRSPCCACARWCAPGRATRPCAPSGRDRAASSRRKRGSSSGSTSSKSVARLDAQAEPLEPLLDHAAAGRSGSAWRGPRRSRPAPRAAPARPRPRR